MSRQLRAQSAFVCIAAVLWMFGPVLLAKVKVQVESDKTFDFKTVRTWAWNPAESGQVMMARTPDDNPESMKKLAEPWILDSVSTEMPKRGLQPAGSGQPDLVATYYLLLSINTSSQTMGQFLPSTTQWGLPPFAPATTAMTVMNRGSLVLDLSSKGNVVWRGVAQGDLQMDIDNKKREEVTREAVRELLKRYPPKK